MDTDAIIVLVVIGAVIVLALDYLVAKQFREIAVMKGYTEADKYLWFTFFFGIAGMLMVAALPDCRSRTASVAKVTKAHEDISDELPEL